ncbi:MAG: LicD family protein [Treponema sp.]|nr:LicD family protein [Treponema sp.]
MEEVSREEYINTLKQELLFIDKLCSEQNIKYFIYYGSLIGAIRHHGMIPWDDDIDIVMPRNDYERFLDYFRKNDTGKYVIVSNNMDTSVPYLISRISDKRYHLEFIKGIQHEIGVFIDIYPLDGMGNSKFIADMHGRICYFLRKLFYVKYGFYYPKGRVLKNTVLKLLKKLLNIHRKPVVQSLLEKIAKSKSFEKSRFVNCPLWADGYITGNLPREYFDKIYRIKFEGIDVNIPAEYDKILTAIYGKYMDLPPESERIMKHFYKVYKNNP